MSLKKRAINGNLLVEPFRKTEHAMANRALPKPVSAEELVGLRVIVGNEKAPTGSTVWVKAEVSGHPLSRAVLQVEGEPAIVIADIHVLFVEG